MTPFTRAIIFCSFVFLAGGCEDSPHTQIYDPPPPQPQPQQPTGPRPIIQMGDTKITIAEGTQKSLIPATVNSLKMAVTGSGVGLPINKLLVRGTDFGTTPDSVSVTLAIPVGFGRIFTVMAFGSSDGSEIPLYQGSIAGVDIKSKANSVNLSLFAPPSAIPTLSGFTPTDGCPGDQITLIGTNFDALLNNNSIIFMGTSTSQDDQRAIPVGHGSEENLTVIVPNGVVTGKVQISNLFGPAKSLSDFTVKSSCPYISPSVEPLLNLSASRKASDSVVATEGDTVLVAWHDHFLGKRDILVSRSTDGGRTFRSPINLSHNVGPSDRPAIAISGATVLVVWDEGASDFPTFGDRGKSSILISRSTDGGAHFDPPVNISQNTGNSFYPAMAISGSTVIVQWEEDPTPGSWGPEDGRNLYSRRSVDGGAHFDSPISLAKIKGYDVSSSVVMSENVVLATWIDTAYGTSSNNVFVSRSTDGGVHFDPPVPMAQMGEDIPYEASLSAVIAGTNILIAWKDSSAEERGGFFGDIVVSHSADEGAHFDPPMNISNTGAAHSPSVAISGTTALVLWTDRSSEQSRNGPPRVLISRSGDGGTTFDFPVSLTLGDVYSPAVAFSGTTTLLTWENRWDGGDILFTRLL